MTNYCGNVESLDDHELLIQRRITFRRWTGFQRWMTISTMDDHFNDGWLFQRWMTISTMDGYFNDG